MANKPITMIKVRQILRHHTEGKNKSEISVLTRTSRNTVKRYLRIYQREELSWEQIQAMNDHQLSMLFCLQEYGEPKAKVKQLQELLPWLEKQLKRRGMTRTRVWKMYLEKHPDGLRHTQFSRYLNLWMVRVHPVMHIEHKAGDKLFIDFAGQKLKVVDKETGELREVEVFAAILGCSQLTYVEAVPSQTKEDLIRCCENALHYLGGVPAAIVPDNLKSAVTKSSKYEPTLNETFEDFASHYGTAVLPTRSYRPRDKALVEGIVKIIYRSIYTSVDEKSFFTIEELNHAIKIELEHHNNALLTHRSYSRRHQFEEIERSTLRPLPMYRYELKKQRMATVMKNGHVCLSDDRHYYSVPYHLIGKKVKLLYSKQEVEIYHRYEKVVTHVRNVASHRYSTIPEHLASAHRYLSDWTPEKFISDGNAIHADVAAYLQNVIRTKQHPEQAYKSCAGILHLAKKVGNQRLINACRRAGEFGVYGYGQLLNILQKNLDQVVEEDNEAAALPRHNNIRGNTYYQ